MLATGKSLQKKKKQFAFLSIFLGVSSVLQWCLIPGIDNTFVWWIIYFAIMIILYKNRNRDIKLLPIKLFIYDFIIMGVVAVLWKIQNYWDWKLLVSNIFIFSLVFAAYTFSTRDNLRIMLRQWFKYSWIPYIVIAPFLESDGFGRYLIPYVFISMFLCDLNRKWYVIIIITLLITVIFGWDDRSEMIKYAATLMLGISFMFSKLRFLLLKLSKGVSLFFLFLPFVLIVLGITDVFNVFKMEESLGLEGKYEMTDSQGETASAFNDTRTFLYQEVISSSIVNDYVVFGRSPGRGYDSYAFDIDLVAGRSERGGCEVGLLNVYNYFGIIGVLLYFYMFAYSVYSVFRHSKNDYMKIVAIYLAFNWTYFWIHNTPGSNLTTLFLFIMIGMCCSVEYLKLTNKEFSTYIKSIVNVF